MDISAQRHKILSHVAVRSAIADITTASRKDLRIHELSERRVVALVILLMDKTAMRIGNAAYEKMYGSYGLTTLRDKHIRINGSKLKIAFVGKKGIKHTIEVNNSRLAKIIKKCRDIPGQELFQYYDTEGNTKQVDSGMVNHYINGVTGEGFTAKDFRTWKASVYAIRALAELCRNHDVPTKKDLAACFDAVSKKLGNSGNICKKYYVHPLVVSTYENGDLTAFIAAAEKRTADDGKFYRNGETVLLDILGKENKHLLQKLMPT